MQLVLITNRLILLKFTLQSFTKSDIVVIGLDKNSDVVKKSGLRIGDRLLGIDVKQSTSLDKSRKTMYSGTLTVDRGGSTNKLAFSKCKRTKFFGKMTFASGRATF